MLLPHQHAILSLEDAKILVKTIEGLGGPVLYEKLFALGSFAIYDQLRDFIKDAKVWEHAQDAYLHWMEGSDE